MAAVSQTILDDGRLLIMKFTSDVADATALKVDVSALASYKPTGAACTGVSIQKIWYSTVALSIEILWDATANVLAWVLPANASDTIDFSCHNGLVNNAGAGKTGDVLFTTTGTPGEYSVILEMRKEYA